QKRTKTLCICFDARDNKKRKQPDTFSTRTLSGEALFVFDDQEAEPKAAAEKAEKPAPEATAASELARFQGSWSVLEMEAGGMTLPTLGFDEEGRRDLALF